MHDVPGQAPVPPPVVTPKKGGARKLAIILSIGAVIVIGVLVAGAIVAIKRITADPGDAIPQPHRVAAKGPRPGNAGPAWTEPDHHWVGLSKAWNVDHGAAYSLKLRQKSLVSAGKQAVEFRDEPFEHHGVKPATITGYDGAGGKRLWQTSRPWAHLADPVAGSGVVIVPSGTEGTSTAPLAKDPLDYVALDAATGARRWSVHADARTFESRYVSLHDNRAQPGGVLLDGVFYYGDGKSVVGVDARTGKQRYTFTGKAFTHVSTPVVVSGRIAVIASPANDDYPETYEAHLFPKDLKKYTSFRLADVDDTPDHVAANGDVLALWNGRDLWTVNVRTGRRLAHLGISASSDVGGVLGRTVLIHEDHGRDAQVIGHDLLTGAKRWTATPFPDSSSRGTVEVADGTAVATGDGISIIDPDTGKVTFRRPLSSLDDDGVAAPAGGRLVFSFDSGIAGYR